MKNYYFDRDFERQLKKATRDLEICMRYEAYGNASEVAKMMNISRTTVKKVISSGQLVKTKQGNFFVRALKTLVQDF